MVTFERSVRTLLLVLAAVTLLPGAAWACPVCFGAAEGPMIDGMNLAILALLGVTGAVLGSFIAFFVYLARRARMVREAEQWGEEPFGSRI